VRLTQAATLTEDVDEQLRAVGERLLEAVQRAKAYGLAAAHLGEVAPVVVISDDVELHTYRLLFNPRVTAVAEHTEKGEEGSVSLPGIRVEIDRPIWAEVSFLDRDSQAQTVRFDGFAARVALHEIEQMRGIFFLERVSRLKRDMALKKAKKLAG